MPEEKGLGSKLLGLFVEVQPKDDGTPAEGTPSVGGEPSAADLIADLARQSDPRAGAQAPAHPAKPVAGKPAMPGPAAAGMAPAPARVAQPMPASSGSVTPATVDFDAVFKGAGLDAGELDRVRKAEELLKSLPEATPQDIKRQIVEASLKAFGFDVQKIIAAAQNQLKAVDTWTRLNEQQTAKSLTDAQAQIAQLEDKIITLKADITKKTEHLAATGAAAELRKAQVQKVLEFFASGAAPAAATKP
jgi:hypothetical protein